MGEQGAGLEKKNSYSITGREGTNSQIVLFLLLEML